MVENHGLRKTDIFEAELAQNYRENKGICLQVFNKEIKAPQPHEGGFLYLVLK